MTLRDDAFAWVAATVRAEAAIVLEPGKEYLVEARLLPLAREAGAADVSSHIDHLRTRGTREQIAAVVEAMTTNETFWFRDREPFDVFTRVVLPEVMRRNAATKKLTIWSAACSSGQEAYSVAMLAHEHLIPAGWSVDIVATDISQSMLDRVAEGRYSQLEVGRGLPAAMLVKHFRKDGTRWQVSDELRSMVRVQHLNLARPFTPLPRFDVVFLRNVLIYFDNQAKRRILDQVRRVTVPGGFLFLGAAETTLGIDESWHRETHGRFTLNCLPDAGPVAGPDVGPVAGPVSDPAAPVSATLATAVPAHSLLGRR